MGCNEGWESRTYSIHLFGAGCVIERACGEGGSVRKWTGDRRNRFGVAWREMDRMVEMEMWEGKRGKKGKNFKEQQEVGQAAVRNADEEKVRKMQRKWLGSKLEKTTTMTI